MSRLNYEAADSDYDIPLHSPTDDISIGDAPIDDNEDILLPDYVVASPPSDLPLPPYDPFNFV